VQLSYQNDLWEVISNPYIFSGGFENLLEIVNGKVNLRDEIVNSTYCRRLSKLMDTSNKYYPAAHSHKRVWKASEYARGAVKEELIQFQKSIYLEEAPN